MMPLSMSQLTAEQQEALTKSLHVINAHIEDDEIIAKGRSHPIDEVDALFDAELKEQEKENASALLLNKGIEAVDPANPDSQTAVSRIDKAKARIEELKRAKTTFESLKPLLDEKKAPTPPNTPQANASVAKPDVASVQWKKKTIETLDKRLHSLRELRESEKKRHSDIRTKMESNVAPYMRPGSWISLPQNAGLLTLFLVLTVGPNYKWRELYDELSRMEAESQAQIQRLDDQIRHSTKEKEELEVEIENAQSVSMTPHTDSDAKDSNITMSPHSDDATTPGADKKIDDSAVVATNTADAASSADEFRFSVGASASAPAQDFSFSAETASNKNTAALVSDDVMEQIKAVSPDVQLGELNGGLALRMDNVPEADKARVQKEVTDILTKANVLQPADAGLHKDPFLSAAAATHQKQQAEVRAKQEAEAKAAATAAPGSSLTPK
jgi:hypothetical protein